MSFKKLKIKVKLKVREIKTSIFGKRKKGEYAYPKDVWNSHKTVLPNNRCVSYSYTKWYQEFNIELLIKYRPFNY